MGGCPVPGSNIPVGRRGSGSRERDAVIHDICQDTRFATKRQRKKRVQTMRVTITTPFDSAVAVVPRLIVARFPCIFSPCLSRPRPPQIRSYCRFSTSGASAPRNPLRWVTSASRTVFDLFFYVPRRYLDRSAIVTIAQLRRLSQQGGSLISGSQEAPADVRRDYTVVGEVRSFRVMGMGRKSRFVLVLADQTGSMQCVWFGGVNFWKKAFRIGETLAVSGQPTAFAGVLQFVHPDLDRISPAVGSGGKPEPFAEPEEQEGAPAVDWAKTLTPADWYPSIHQARNLPAWDWTAPVSGGPSGPSSELTWTGSRSASGLPACRAWPGPSRRCHSFGTFSQQRRGAPAGVAAAQVSRAFHLSAQTRSQAPLGEAANEGNSFQPLELARAHARGLAAVPAHAGAGSRHP